MRNVKLLPPGTVRQATPMIVYANCLKQKTQTNKQTKQKQKHSGGEIKIIMISLSEIENEALKLFCAPAMTHEVFFFLFFFYLNALFLHSYRAET